MRSLLRRRDFGLLWTAGLITFTGDWVLFVGLPLVVYGLTGSTLSTSGIFIAALLPRIVWGSLAGVLVDRWDRRRTLVFANLAQTVVLLPLLAVESADRIWIAYAVAFVHASLEQVVEPAEGALLPRLVGEEDLVAANALNSLNNNLARLIGPALGGVAVAAGGIEAVVLLDAASFLGAAGLIALISADGRAARASSIGDEAVEAVTGFWREWLAGLRLIRRTRTAAVLVAVAALTGLGEGALITIFVPFVTETLGGDEIDYGLILSAQAVGGLAGAVLIARFAAASPAARLLGLGAIGIGLIDVVIFVHPLFVDGIALAIALLVVVGLPVAAYGAGLGTLRQTAVEDAYRGRLLGAYGTTLGLSLLVGTIVAGVLGDVVGLLPLLLVQSAVYTAAGVLVLWALPNRGHDQGYGECETGCRSPVAKRSKRKG
ncbi:MAG: MFS transporter [Actinobacteria bacterium]|nr:MFS transporter [Actinomycetota bacterium]